MVNKVDRGRIAKEVKKVKGNALKGSDIDIGILGKEKAPWSSMTKISQEVEKIPTLRSIDVVDLNAIEENFKNKVLEYAKVL